MVCMGRHERQGGQHDATRVTEFRHHAACLTACLFTATQHWGVPCCQITCLLMMLHTCCVQGMSKIKEMENVMVTYYREHLDEAGVGLEILPGVKDLLEALKVGAAVCEDEPSLMKHPP